MRSPKLLIREVESRLGLSPSGVRKLDPALAPERLGSQEVRVYDEGTVEAVAGKRDSKFLDRIRNRCASLYSGNEVCEALGISDDEFLARIKDGRIKTFLISHRGPYFLLLDKDVIDAAEKGDE